MNGTLRRLKRWVAEAAGRRRPADGGASSLRELLTLAWPIAAAMAGETVMGLVDTKLVGGLGAAALGGVGIGSTFMWLGYWVVFGVLRGVKIRTAHAVGERSPERGVRYTQAGVVIAVLWGLSVWLVARSPSWIFANLGVDPAIVPYARDFFTAVTFGAPGACLVSAFTQHRQALGDSRTPMIVGIAGNVFNASLGYCLIYGHLGLPALGVRGAGYSTAATETMEAAAMALVFLRDARRAKGLVVIPLPMARALREVLALGIPTGLQFGAEILAFTTFTALLGSVGAEQLAAHQAALATIRTSFLPGVAVGEAASVLVGQALGRKSLREADRTTGAALFVATAFMAACGIVFAVFGRLLARAMTPDEHVALITQRLLLIAAVFQVLDAVNIVLRGALRGAKDVRVPAAIGIGVVWLCVPGAAYMLGKLAGWGAVGGWCGFVAETTLASVLFGLRWRKGAWRRAYAGEGASGDATAGLGAPAE
jgi:MATE family multidrug resistance protein